MSEYLEQDSFGEDTPQELDRLRAKYGKVYLITLSNEADGESETELEYCFTKPKPASYDRYMKTLSASMTKASLAFCRDNIVPEHKDRFERDIEEYPAMPMNIGEKLLMILGWSKSTNFRQL